MSAQRRLPKLGRALNRLGYHTYAEYLRSDHWQNFRALWAPRRTREGKPVCEFCLAGHLRLDLHHRTYKHLGAERAEDMVLLCERCHGRAHRWFNTGRKSLWKTTAAVARAARR